MDWLAKICWKSFVPLEMVENDWNAKRNINIIHQTMWILTVGCTKIECLDAMVCCRRQAPALSPDSTLRLSSHHSWTLAYRSLVHSCHCSQQPSKLEIRKITIVLRYAAMSLTFLPHVTSTITLNGTKVNSNPNSCCFTVSSLGWHRAAEQNYVTVTVGWFGRMRRYDWYRWIACNALADHICRLHRYIGFDRAGAI